MSELLTVKQVADILGVGEDTVARRFKNVKGVIDLGSSEKPKRRRYRILRIPTAVVEKFLLSRGGGPVHIEPPLKKQSKGKAGTPVLDEDEIVRQLARTAKQRGAEAQKTLDKIAERARLLKFVPESQWSEVVWLDEEE